MEDLEKRKQNKKKEERNRKEENKKGEKKIEVDLINLRYILASFLTNS